MFRGLNIAGSHIAGFALAMGLFAPFDGVQAMQFELVYAFKYNPPSNNFDGASPTGGLVADKNGNLYGTTSFGGSGPQRGTVFKLAPNGAETVICSFLNSLGNEPQFGVIMDEAGNLYGTTSGGSWPSVFKLAPDGTETTLRSFDRPIWGRLIVDKAGNLFGTTRSGGTGFGGIGCGTVFMLAPDGTETTLHTFNGAPTDSSGVPADGVNPAAGLVMDKSGNLYGTTVRGGSGKLGTVFKLAPDRIETVIHSFKGGVDGAYPFAEVLRDKSGALYGTTLQGGGPGCNGYGCGTVFRIARDGTETVLHAFKGGSDAGYPTAPLIMDKSGNLYGTTDNSSIYGFHCFAPANCGTAFRLAPDGTETVLHTFTVAEGGSPQGGLYMDKAGNLFGAIMGAFGMINASSGLQFGSIFELKK